MAQPKLLTKAWAADGLKNNIPATRDSGLAQEAATYAEGFPSITMTPISVGGKPPSGKDMNGVLHEITANIAWQNRGGRYRFDQAFCDAIGGYPKGAVLMGDTLDTEYISLADANTHNPNNGGNDGKWAAFAGKGLKASTTQSGIVQLSSATNSDSEELAATPKAVKAAYDKAVSAKASLATATEAGLVKLINNLTSGGTDAALSAEQGKVLAGLIASAVPSGTVIWHAGSSAPAGYLKANGAAVSRTAYAALFTAIGTTYGAGDGRNTFNLPDLRGEFIRGWDDGRGVDNGRALGSAQGDVLAAHLHGVGLMSGVDDAVFIRQRWGERATKQYNVIQMNGQLNYFQEYNINPAVPHGSFQHYLATSEGEQLSSNAGETRSRNIALLACIKI